MAEHRWQLPKPVRRRASLGVDRSVDQGTLGDAVDERRRCEGARAQRSQSGLVVRHRTLHDSFGANDRGRIAMTRARRVDELLGEEPGPGGNGGWRDPARADDRHAVRLAGEERQQLDLERVVRWDPLYEHGTVLALLAKTDALELDRAVLDHDLAPDVAYLGAQAARDEVREWVVTHRACSGGWGAAPPNRSRRSRDSTACPRERSLPAARVGSSAPGRMRAARPRGARAVSGQDV